MKKLLKVFLATFVLVCSLSVLSAADPVVTRSAAVAWYKATKRSNRTYWYQYKMPIIRVDGKIGYCLEPNKSLVSGSGYSETTLWNDLASDKRDLIYAYSYYGYEYPGHESNINYYLATQQLIWDVLGWDTSWTTISGGRTISVSKEVAEIKRLALLHFVKPSFTGADIPLKIGESITLTDTNGVLSEYNIADVEGLTITKSGNQVTIRLDSWDGAEKLVSGSRISGVTEGAPIIYRKRNSQDVLSIHNADPVRFDIRIRLDSTPITIEKIDTLGQNVADVTFLIGQEPDLSDGVTFTTDQTGRIKLDVSPGTYYIQEIAAPPQYVMDEAIYEFDVEAVPKLEFDVEQKYQNTMGIELAADVTDVLLEGKNFVGSPPATISDAGITWVYKGYFMLPNLTLLAGNPTISKINKDYKIIYVYEEQSNEKTSGDYTVTEKFENLSSNVIAADKDRFFDAGDDYVGNPPATIVFDGKLWGYTGYMVEGDTTVYPGTPSILAIDDDAVFTYIYSQLSRNVITEKYHDEDGYALADDKINFAVDGDNFTGNPPQIVQYLSRDMVYIGYMLPGDTDVQEGVPSLTNITQDIQIIYMYEEYIEDTTVVIKNMTVTYTNGIRPVQARLIKVTEEGGIPLQGAVIQLFNVDNKDFPILIDMRITNAEGIVNFRNLNYFSTYQIVELIPPEGYDFVNGINSWLFRPADTGYEQLIEITAENKERMMALQLIKFAKDENDEDLIVLLNGALFSIEEVDADNNVTKDLGRMITGGVWVESTPGSQFAIVKEDDWDKFSVMERHEFFGAADATVLRVEDDGTGYEFMPDDNYMVISLDGSGEYEYSSAHVSQGTIIFPAVGYGKKYRVCELMAPDGYSRGVNFCEIIEPRADFGVDVFVYERENMTMFPPNTGDTNKVLIGGIGVAVSLLALVISTIKKEEN